VSVYLDASVLASLFISDPHSSLAARRLRQVKQALVVSDFGAAEFASAVSKRVRMRLTQASVARTAFLDFDVWVAANAQIVEMASADVAASGLILRRLDSKLRTPDALHIAIVHRLGADLLTLDVDMKMYARKAGLQVV
jgi:predicted nucleic acid-binding protein